MHRSFLLLLVFSLTALLPLRAEQSAEEQKLVGDWRYEDAAEKQVANYSFRADGTFTSELHQNGELVRKFEGRWTIEKGMIVYIYETDSIGKVMGGARERDRLERLDESSYTIEAGDGGHRTYWRVKATE